MKIYQIALVLYLANLLLTTLVVMNDTESLGFEIPSTLTAIEGMGEAEILNASSQVTSSIEAERGVNILEDVAQSIWKSVQMVWTVVSIFSTTLLNSTVMSGVFINMWFGGNLPFELVALITITTTLIWIIGIAQIISGRSTKDME